MGELAAFGDVWHVGDAVVGEAHYIWEIAPDGSRSQVPIDLQTPIADGLLKVVQPESDAELDAYVDFASELDDGEAQAMAIAMHRGFILLTDERKALQIAQRVEVGVRTITTAQVLQKWVAHSAANAGRLPQVLRSIEERARFRPRQGSVDGEWWERYRT